MTSMDVRKEFDAFPVDFDRITPDHIKAAFENGGPDFTNFVVAVLAWKTTGNNLSNEAKAKLNEVIDIGQGFYLWADISHVREATG